MKAFSEWASWTAKVALLSAIPNVSLAIAATSDDLFNDYFSNVLDGAPCFARTYGDDDLQAHPDTRVRKIEIDLSKNNSDGTPNTPDHFALNFSVMLTSGSDWFGQTASCKTNQDNFECYLDGDGGMFHLLPQKSSGLRLQIGDQGIALDGSDTEIELPGKNGIDRTFDLVPSKEECQSASSFFDNGND